MVRTSSTSMASNNKSSLLKKLTQFLVRKTYGDAAIVTEHVPSPIAGVVAFYYVEHGMRHYIFVSASESNELQFASCLGFQGYQNIAEALQHTVTTFFGKSFMRAFDRNLLSMENIKTVPVFSYKETAEQNYNVHTFAWHIQLTPEQAQLCQPENDDVDILAVPEMNIAQQKLSKSHLAVLTAIKSAERNAHTRDMYGDLQNDLLEDILQGAPQTARTIH